MKGLDIKTKKRKCEYCGITKQCVPALMPEGGTVICPACIVNYHTYTWEEHDNCYEGGCTKRANKTGYCKQHMDM